MEVHTGASIALAQCAGTARKFGLFSLALALVAAGSVVFAGIAHADGVSTDGTTPPAPRIVNGLTTNAWETVGAVATGPDPAEADHFCTGTLIGCSTFVTAAHCLGAIFDPARYGVFLQHAGMFAVSGVAQHPDADDLPFPLADIAVLKLATPVQSITPTPINQFELGPYDPFVPLPGTIVGFGQTRVGGNDFNIKRVGQIMTDTCDQAPAPPFGGNDELVCWSFEKPVAEPGLSSNTCHGDSGGPLFIDFGTGPMLAGVTSGGTNFTCLANDLSYQTSVEHYKEFVLQQLGTDSVAACGGLPTVDSAGASITSADGYLGSWPRSRTYEVLVPTGAGRLVTTFNGRNPTSGVLADFDFYVRHGAPPTDTEYDCATIGSGQFGDCRFDSPAPGTWYATVKLGHGDGEFQFNGTVLGGNPPVCGNAIREPGEQCDAGDDAGCEGACAGDCTCPRICKTGVAEVRKMTVRSEKTSLTVRLYEDPTAPFLAGLDPREAFDAVLDDGARRLVLAVPDFDLGWLKSAPARGRYRWKGDLGGLRRVRVNDRIEKRGYIKVTVVAKQIERADTLDPASIVSEIEIQNTCFAQ